MAEAGGPSIAEVQTKPAGVVDRVKSKLREVLTPTGRAEVMAQKQIDAILVQVPEEKRAEAMEILESKRPEFVAGKMEDAKGSLVRDAAIGAAVVGGVTGVGIWQKEWISKNVKLGAENVFKLFKKTQPKTLSEKVLESASAVREDNIMASFRIRLRGLIPGVAKKVVNVAQKIPMGQPL